MRKSVSKCILKIILRFILIIGSKVVKHVECDHSSGTLLNILCTWTDEVASKFEKGGKSNDN